MPHAVQHHFVVGNIEECLPTAVAWHDGMAFLQSFRKIVFLPIDPGFDRALPEVLDCPEIPINMIMS